MTQEEKQLLLTDICARLPYDLKCKIDLNSLLKVFPEYGARLSYAATLTGVDLHAKVGERVYTLFGIPSKHRLYFLELDDFFDEYGVPVECVKPYLRPLSSMTEEEKEEASEAIEIELKALQGPGGFTVENAASYAFMIDFYNKHHLDYRGLIEKGLALEAPEGMYTTE